MLIAVPVLAGILLLLFTNIFVINQRKVGKNTFSVDKTQSRQGANSLKWEFALQPQKKYRVSKTAPMGSYLHIEVLPDRDGNIRGLDLAAFRGIRFFAKSRSEGLQLTEFNVFSGPTYLQYLLDTQEKILLTTRWNRFFVDFDQLRLAPWGKPTRDVRGRGLSNVTALGWDMKAFSDRPHVSGTIWLDNIRLIARDGSEIVLSDAEHIDWHFNNKALTWRSDWQDY